MFARARSEHKLRIVGALQRKDHIVAMTGDGIHDPPPSRRQYRRRHGDHRQPTSRRRPANGADRRQFASIVKAIEEGRGIYDNIRKYLIYLLSSNAASC